MQRPLCFCHITPGPNTMFPCVYYPPPPGVPTQVVSRQALLPGVDVVEADTWGMDCYTRRNVFDAVLEAGAALGVCVCRYACTLQRLGSATRLNSAH